MAVPVGLHAQAAPPSGAVASEVAAPRGKTLLEMFQAGGITMYPLLLLSMGASAFIVYNFVNIRSKVILQPEVAKQIEDAVSQLNLTKAVVICEENESPLTNIVNAGLSRVDLASYDPEDFKTAAEEASSEELSGPFVFINYLSVIGSLSPMLGLLGTVSGMVKAFNKIQAEGAGNAQALAGDISEALITTATGMIIGIPAMFFYFFFKNRYGTIVSGVGRVVGDIHFILNSAVKRGAEVSVARPVTKPMSRPDAPSR